MSRSVRYAIGITLVLVLLGAGSGYALARWSQGQKEAPADWRAMVRGGACVASELREVIGDVADLLSPDRAPEPLPQPQARADRDAASDEAGQSGRPGQSGRSSETDDADGSGGSPLENLLAQGRDYVASLTDGVPRLDEPAAAESGAREGRDGC